MNQTFSTATVSEPRHRMNDEITPILSAVERYKEIIGTATGAIDAMRERDRKRCGELVERLAASQDRMAEIMEREQLVRLGVELHWEFAMESLWHERWMTMTPRPEPDESVPVREQGAYDTAMDLAYQALQDALQKRTLLRRRHESQA